MGSWQAAFFEYICQTSDAPLGLEIVRAEGPYLFAVDGRRYLDLISGIGVTNIGHGRREVLTAISEQAGKYLHPMVYGEYVLAPQVAYAEALVRHLPGETELVFFANSGAEAIEGALKTARKHTGRAGIVSFEGCYHGDTMGALSCQSTPRYREPFEPLIPGCTSLPLNDIAALERIDEGTAAVILEPVQGEAGVRIPDTAFLKALRRRCDIVECVLIFDEVMTGFGRTGKLFASEHWGVVPDLIVLAKALGGGLPLGAFAGPRRIMQTLSNRPPLSHVTTFGGNPLSCAAGLAAFKVLLRDNLAERAARIGKGFREGLNALRRSHPEILEVRELGCLIGVDFESAEKTMGFARACLDRGLIVGWTLHHSNILRMAPPLILTDEEIDETLGTMRAALADA